MNHQTFLKEHPELSAKSEIDNIKKPCMKFYIEVATQLKARFDFSDPIFQFINVVDPPFAQSFETKELSEVIKRFPYLANIIHKQNLDIEWMDHALLDHETLDLDSKLPASQYWKKVFPLKIYKVTTGFPI